MKLRPVQEPKADASVTFSLIHPLSSHKALRLLSYFYRRKYGGTEKLDNLPKATQPVVVVPIVEPTWRLIPRASYPYAALWYKF